MNTSGPGRGHARDRRAVAEPENCCAVLNGGIMSKRVKKRSETPRIASHIIEGRDLQRRLGMSERELRELAQRHKLPFSFSALAGLFIRARDLPQWEAAARK